MENFDIKMVGISKKGKRNILKTLSEYRIIAYQKLQFDVLDFVELSQLLQALYNTDHTDVLMLLWLLLST